MSSAFREAWREARMVFDMSEFEETSMPQANDRHVEQDHTALRGGCRKKVLDTRNELHSRREIDSSLEDVMRRLKDLHLFLDDVLSNEEFQSMNLETRAALEQTAMEERDRLEAQKKKELAKQEAALQRQSRRLRKVVEFANKLMTLTGASPEHPWIQKLFEVAEMSLDPRKLLRAYKSEDGKLAITDHKNPSWCWLPYVPRSKQEMMAMSRSAALEAIVGNLGDGRKLKGFLYTRRSSPWFLVRFSLSALPAQLESAVSRR
ncbi:hypothetical protein COCOBI_01-8060 [Coccomyxa sp. Obi]|nr:hypothetical protein COCOBI_01-8060 [Coccomyxa sp. Obi]